MPFTVDDFQDLLRLLDQHPEWQDTLRRHILSRELLELPQIMRDLAARVQQLADAQLRTEQQIAALAARVDDLGARLDRLTEQVEHLTARVDQLAVRMDQLAEQVEHLTARLDQLTARMDQLAEQVEHLTARVDQLTARVDQLTEQVEHLTARVDQLTARVDQLAVRMDQLAEAQRQTEISVASLADRVGVLTGEVLELRYERRAPAYFGRLARRLRVLPTGTLADLLDDAVEERRLTEAERDQVLASDLVLIGQRRDDRSEVYLLVEISAGIGVEDVRRAADRAGVLARLGRPVLPVVAGNWIAPEAAALAAERAVWQVLDGSAVSPEPS